MSQESTTPADRSSPTDPIGTEIVENRARIVFDPEAPLFRTLLQEQLASADLLTTNRRSTDGKIVEVRLDLDT